jgi:hypothetical protein
MFFLWLVPDELAVAQEFAVLFLRRLSQRWLLILRVLASDGAASSGCRLGVGVPNLYVDGWVSQLGMDHGPGHGPFMLDVDVHRCGRPAHLQSECSTAAGVLCTALLRSDGLNYDTSRHTPKLPQVDCTQFVYDGSVVAC